MGFNRITKIAAVVSIIIISCGLWYFNAEIIIDQPIQEVAEIITKQTQSGQQLPIMLPDGSKVKLNSNSSISYPSNFTNNRIVEFEGEAFFSVVRDESSPFVVKTENFVTEVLGTSFNLRAYKHSIAKVSVAEGKVKVSSLLENNEQYYKILENGYAANIDNKHIIDADFDMNEILWKDGILVFSNENIQGISMKIEQWFNVSVKVTNNDFISGDFSGKYEKNESLEEILNGIGYALNFDFVIQEREININGKIEK